MTTSVATALQTALDRGEVGIQAAAYKGDTLVVNEWAGTVSDDAGAAAVGESTVFPIFSVTKALTATAIHLQAERGLIDYEAPVASYWPEYAVNGKESITIRHVLTHRAGVPQMPSDITPDKLADWDWIVERLAEVTPCRPPGKENTYLSYTFGWILGEVVRRTDPQRRSFQSFVADEVCAPLGIEALWLGMPDSAQARVATVSRPEGKKEPVDLEAAAAPMAIQFVASVFNRPDVRAASIPAAGAIADARSVARLFSLLANRGMANGVRLLSEERVKSFLEPREDTFGWDAVLDSPGGEIGVGGYYLSFATPAGKGFMSPGGLQRPVLCQAGSGGSVGWADPETGISLAVCHNRLFYNPPEPPIWDLGEALYTTAQAG